MIGALADPARKFVSAALECSVYHAPREPGLSPEELREACGRAGYLPGEIADAIEAEAQEGVTLRQPRLLPVGEHAWFATWLPFAFLMDPEYRSPAAFDFVYTELERVRLANRAKSVRIDRDVLVELGIVAGLACNDVEVAITSFALEGRLRLEGTTIVPNWTIANLWPTCTEQRAKARPAVRRNEMRAKAYSIVGDIVAGRTDGRYGQVEPLDAFAGVLPRLVHSGLKTW